MSKRAEAYMRLARAHADDIMKGAVPKGVSTSVVVSLVNMYYTGAMAEMKYMEGVPDWDAEDDSS